MSEQLNNPQVILELTVRNHPGVMSHVCGLFARRAFNVEGILCLPLKDGKQSRIWLLVADDQRLMQMISQVEKLEDVLQVKRHSEDVRVFEQLEAFFQ
ncbi:Acetolactate synthase isozyme 1 small subunit [Serratia quinivorans]|jgi:acetolactate synthase-1/3 small subunit|uniref:acetolactate synthase n=3 Tax=Serratia TaxID=613 RepID=A0A2X2HX21_9GAMM|nr:MULTISPECIES: acetolactate synthase small subunit [Serratia]MBV6694262.1 acetolactate synthase small subunit [Serratia quinivorans]MCS4266771.1 acetolactate synthase-1/3 small subunit [Serratia sp. BIGb0163]QBX67030.1 acetolactate synthase 1 small subunit [Serratia quinivorans]QGH60607.1 acetolactate synthase small subunit [Serratia proteamaculans]RYM63624.1 acetolactate synthase isozyme 1 small subunit [Serratia proteamaculans]